MTYALITLLCVYLLWVHYVAVMHLKHMREDGLLPPRKGAGLHGTCHWPGARPVCADPHQPGIP